MMFNASEILKATRGKLLAGSKGASIKGVSIDSRTIERGELFIAIRGARYDGHTFVREALRKGAAGAVVHSKSTSTPDVTKSARESVHFIVAVNDTVKALADIAGFHRNRFDIPVVAVTGSNGKTTTKEMVENILRNEWSPLKNIGTQNNLIGIPLTLLKLTKRHKSAVMELGMNKRGEIDSLAGLARPNIGVVTNVGPAHLEYLKTLDAVYRAKKELLDYLGRGDIAVLNNDDIFLRYFSKKGLKIFTFGIDRISDFRATNVKREKRGWRFKVEDKLYFINLPAYHDIYNALAAISVGTLFDIDCKDIAGALNEYKPLEKRMTRSIFRGVEFIDDTYNSNPLSLESAIRTLAGYKTRGKRILVSGDMLELGKKAVYYHQRIGGFIARSGIDNFIGVGELMRNSFLSAKRCGMKNIHYCSSKEEAAALLRNIARSNDVVLVKGSRATQMEDVIKCFTTSSTR
jgi:UDP-N-acetylmuramoyl-tripeptide--D-alanyl-D-alanine ligase